VAVGPARGRTLEQVVREWGRELIGRAEFSFGRFPLLIKFLDAVDTLSVQVHPDAAMAARLGGTVREKHEAWYVLLAEGDAAIYHGVKPGVTRRDFEAAVRDGTVERMINRIPVSEGQMYYLPSGTVHALGAGVVVAEVQTSSDITYRVFDWNRIDPATGQSRELHVDLALDCIDFDRHEPPTQPRSHVASCWTAVTRLAACESFIVEKVRMIEGMVQEIPYAEMVVWMVLSGSGTIGYGRGESIDFQAGHVVVLPAALKDGRVKTHQDCVWLEVTLPVRSPVE
jgi:mannose-6-phosphate isomerase